MRHILPRQLESTGLHGKGVVLGEDTVLSLIRRFTREAGVRNLERALETVLRKLARKIAAGAKGPFEVRPSDLERMLGPAPFFHEDRVSEDRVGLAAGLAWTEAGGEILYVEAAALEGNGALTLTGQLGDVMKESIQAAFTYIKEHAAEYGLKPKELAKKDIHVHLPQGAIPKDGPSAGITMAVALLSAISGKPVSHTTAFTGEITLRGDVLMVGGLREKLLAACRARFKKVVLPEANRHEQRDFPKAALEQLKLVYVKTMDEVFREALQGAMSPKRPHTKARSISNLSHHKGTKGTKGRITGR
jgi:ATP-dependent Lon protease